MTTQQKIALVVLAPLWLPLAFVTALAKFVVTVIKETWEKV